LNKKKRGLCQPFKNFEKVDIDHALINQSRDQDQSQKYGRALNCGSRCCGFEPHQAPLALSAKAGLCGGNRFGL